MKREKVITVGVRLGYRFITIQFLGNLMVRIVKAPKDEVTALGVEPWAFGIKKADVWELRYRGRLLDCAKQITWYFLRRGK